MSRVSFHAVHLSYYYRCTKTLFFLIVFIDTHDVVSVIIMMENNRGVPNGKHTQKREIVYQ